MLDKYKIPMPNQSLTDDEIKQYLAYFKWADQNLQPAAATSQPQPAAAGTALPPSRDALGHADAGARGAGAGASPARTMRLAARSWRWRCSRRSPRRGVGLRRLHRGQGGRDLRPRRGAARRRRGNVVVFCEVQGSLDVRR